MKAYESWVNEFARNAQSGSWTGRIPGHDMQAEAVGDQLLDYVMLRLRLADGIPMLELQNRFGHQAAEIVESTLLKNPAYASKYACESWLQGQRHIRLTDPEGFLMSNDCIAALFAELPDDDDDAVKTASQLSVSI